MARRTHEERDYYEEQYQKLILDKINDVHDDLKENTRQTKITNGRVNKLEHETARIEAEVHDIKQWKNNFIVTSKKPISLDNKKLAYLALVALVFFLVIIAAVLGVKLPGII